MQLLQPEFVVTADLTSAGDFKSRDGGGVVVVDVCDEVIVLVHLQLMSSVNPCVERYSQLEDVDCLLLLVDDDDVRDFGGDTEVRGNGAIGRSGEAGDVTVNLVLLFINEIDDVVDYVVMTPCVPSLVEIGTTTV